MTEPKLCYVDHEDRRHLVLAEDDEAKSLALSPTMTAELHAQGESIGLEILQARAFLRETRSTLAQAHHLPLGAAQA